jgi:hypothetical protein
LNVLSGLLADDVEAVTGGDTAHVAHHSANAVSHELLVVAGVAVLVYG